MIFSTTITRNRLLYLFMIFIVLGLGLASRRYPQFLPNFIATYAGDTLWALLVFLLIGFIWPSLSIFKSALIALSFSLMIELSQLYHVPWLDELRRQTWIALVIGRGFLWSDLVCYMVGIGLGVIGELSLKPLKKMPPINL